MSRGTRNFDRCQVRRISQVPYYKYMHNSDETWVEAVPQGRDVTNFNLGYSSVLDCPRSNKEISSSPDSVSNWSLSKLREAAAKIVCANCVFANMSPEQADSRLAEQAEARTRRLHADIELAKAQQAYDEVMRTIGQEAARAIEEDRRIEPH